MTPAELRKWLGQYDATPPEDARRRQAIRESMVLHTPDLARAYLAALEMRKALKEHLLLGDRLRAAIRAFDAATGGGDD